MSTFFLLHLWLPYFTRLHLMVCKMDGKWLNTYISNKTCTTCGRLLESKEELISDFFYGLLHTDVQVLDERQELIYSSSVWTQDVV